MGAYPIAAELGTLAAKNYSSKFVTGKLTITKAPLTVIAKNASRTVGEPNPKFGYTDHSQDRIALSGELRVFLQERNGRVRGQPAPTMDAVSVMPLTWCCAVPGTAGAKIALEDASMASMAANRMREMGKRWVADILLAVLLSTTGRSWTIGFPELTRRLAAELLMLAGVVRGCNRARRSTESGESGLRCCR